MARYDYSWLVNDKHFRFHYFSILAHKYKIQYHDVHREWGLRRYCSYVKLDMILSGMYAPCRHKNAYFFHDNAPKYCPDCDHFIEGGKVI